MGGKTLIAMSGGVDSAVAALRLRDEGHAVEGLFMSNWEEDEQGYCTAAEDFQDARRVCEEIGIPLHRVSFAREYRDRVFAEFLREYRAGRTPNPDVLCNREIKFGSCLAYARRLGAARFATGHYARVGPDGGLRRAADPAKDQTYFLHAVTAAELRQTLFPVGGLCKDEVRTIARERGLPVHAKHDSTGICFIGERPFREFLSGFLPPRPGPIETAAGEVLGRHTGLEHYTTGQRSGLGIGGRAGGPEGAWYVAGKDLARNALIVVQGHDHPALFCRGLSAAATGWVQGLPPAREFDCTAKVRYRQDDVPCRVHVQGGRADVTFAEPVRAATPGQYVVFYAGEDCLGGGVIVALEPLRAAA